ncbi:MAG: HAD-IA family hydrolase [Actinobacteria bacterium]|nr:HAD-IA family hydrolase [Actinomycetota bacterium]MBV9255061.1 HAD-IA family hydrolase [Actinomycetota bacterium]MBV9933947.1 HAD-IA family hydrolase [Actinomycetota bacterium]
MPEIRAAFFDFGGVILSSPFEAFAEYERRTGLPDGFIRGLNATNPDTNAWAQLERNTVPFDEFCRLYEGEATEAGHDINAREVMALLSGTVRPEMVGAVQRCKERLKTACLTNNFVSFEDFPVEARAEGRDAVLELFDVIIESSKVGVRKPDPRFYEIACEACGVEPAEAVFLDDLGINLKPAKAMGMTTIKVIDPDQALAELEAVVGFPVR